MTEPTNAQLAIYVADAAALLKRHGHDHAATHVQLAAQRLEKQDQRGRGEASGKRALGTSPLNSVEKGPHR
jgi:hypothetical protein